MSTALAAFFDKLRTRGYPVSQKLFVATQIVLVHFQLAGLFHLPGTPPMLTSVPDGSTIVLTWPSLSAITVHIQPDRWWWTIYDRARHGTIHQFDMALHILVDERNDQWPRPPPPDPPT